MYRVTRLANGLTAATAEMPHMASVCVGLWVAAGSRGEPRALNGATHFIEHMLFKGTRRRSAEQISQAVEGVGGYLNAFTTEEYTCYHARAGHEHFPELLEVLADMFLNSTFEPRELRKEREVIKEEVASYLDQPHQLVHELLNATLWPGHPLGRPLTGTAHSLDGLGRAQLLNFLHRHYTSGATLLVVTGRCRHAQVLNAIRRLAGRFTPGPRPHFEPFIPRQKAPSVRLCRRETSQLQMALGIRAWSRHDPRRYALRLLNVLLGENMSSRLFQSLREERGLAYSVHSSVILFEDVGVLTISAGLDPDKLHQALRLIRREFRRLLTNLPTAAELRRARDYLAGQLDLSLEGTENQMNWVGEQLLCYGRIHSAAEIKLGLAAVRPADIRAVARDLLRPERMSLAVVSPLKKSSGLASLLCP